MSSFCLFLNAATQAIHPNGGANGRNIVLCAKRFQQAVVAAAGDDGLFVRTRLFMGFEDEAGIIVEIARKTRREEKILHVEAMRGHEAEPGVEAIKALGEVEMGGFGEFAQFGRSAVGVALDGQKTFDDGAFLGGELAARFERSLFEETIGDLAGAAAADGGNAGDRKKIFDERARTLLVGAFKSGEHAAIVVAFAVFRRKY